MKEEEGQVERESGKRGLEGWRLRRKRVIRAGRWVERELEEIEGTRGEKKMRGEKNG